MLFVVSKITVMCSYAKFWQARALGNHSYASIQYNHMIECECPITNKQVSSKW